MDILEIVKKDINPVGVIGSPSDTFEAVVDILGISSSEKLLGELVYFLVSEGDKKVLVLGQITDIRTENKWHEEPAFKAVIKRHGYLPHISGNADNRIAKITVQSSFNLADLSKPLPHKLSNSPSTGDDVKRMNNELMEEIVADISKKSVLHYIGNAYDTDVHIPFWFHHFGEGFNGAGEAYHIGVFGRTGSGKTATAAQIIKGYATNKEEMSVLIIDPMAQFYKDKNLLFEKENGSSVPVSFQKTIENLGVNYSKYNLIEDVYLPGNRVNIFADILVSTGFVTEAFKPIYDNEKLNATREGIINYLEGRQASPGFSLNKIDPDELLVQMLNRFITPSNKEKERCEGFSKYIYQIWGTKQTRNRLQMRLEEVLNDKPHNVIEKWLKAFELFMPIVGEKEKISLNKVVSDLLDTSGNLVILNVKAKKEISDNIPVLFIDLIEREIVEQSEEKYGSESEANLLVVIDEAHRYVSTDTSDIRIKQLSKNIVDSVRTTRKLGVGYMLITQTIESIDEEIIRQMRIFGFGYGLTMGKEFRAIKDIINDENAAKFYRSFIDPKSNQKYPFMFHGPISPLSFTGSPLFLEMN